MIVKKSEDLDISINKNFGDKTYQSNRRSLLNSFFSRNMVRELIEGKLDGVYASALKRYLVDVDDKCIGELIREVYSELKDGYRNEYYYKNTLLNKLLLGIHSIHTTTALTELPIAKSKADFLLINGKAIVFEIKSDLDGFDRLYSQIDDYYKAFDHVAVVTCEKNLQSVNKVIGLDSRPIGVYILKKNGKLSSIKKPLEYSSDLNKDVMFKILRKNEYENIILQKYGKLPDVSQFKYYSSCRELFMGIPTKEAYGLFICSLKNRIVIEKEVIESIPYELRFLAYFMELKYNDCERISSFLECQCGGV